MFLFFKYKYSKPNVNYIATSQDIQTICNPTLYIKAYRPQGVCTWYRPNLLRGYLVRGLILLMFSAPTNYPNKSLCILLKSYHGAPFLHITENSTPLFSTLHNSFILFSIVKLRSSIYYLLSFSYFVMLSFPVSISWPRQ